MVPYLTERMLQQSPTLAPLGALAAQHCERMDGSGYPRGLRGAAIPIAARVLAAASVYQAMCEPRPHRPAHAPEGAALELRGEVRAGRLDGEAVEAVLREVEVLRLVARGQSTKEVAWQLGITPKTAGNHIEHIDAEIGARNRRGRERGQPRAGAGPRGDRLLRASREGLGERQGEPPRAARARRDPRRGHGVRDGPRLVRLGTQPLRLVRGRPESGRQSTRTCIDSNVLAAASTWELRVRPREGSGGGSAVEMTFARRFRRSPAGRIGSAFNHLGGRRGWRWYLRQALKAVEAS